MTGEEVAARARALVGTRYRLHGRDPAGGLDCVGLVACVLAPVMAGVAVPTGYALRGGDACRIAERLDAVMARGDAAATGAVLLAVPGPAQFHLGIRTAGGLVHADAGLRRVVERPGPSPWPVIGAWQT